jgi:hypothetical protein
VSKNHGKKPTVSQKPAQEPEEVPNEKPEEGGSGDTGESANPPSDSPRTITIPGTGNLSIMVDGKPELIERGKEIKASPSMITVLGEAGIGFEEKAKKGDRK